MEILVKRYLNVDCNTCTNFDYRMNKMHVKARYRDSVQNYKVLEYLTCRKGQNKSDGVRLREKERRRGKLDL